MPLCIPGFHNINASVKRNALFTRIYDPAYKVTPIQNPQFSITQLDRALSAGLKGKPQFSRCSITNYFYPLHMSGRILNIWKYLYKNKTMYTENTILKMSPISTS